MADDATAAGAHAHLTGEFSALFPLALRISLLGSLSLFAWASTLHLLSAWGIDTAVLLDVRVDDVHLSPLGSHHIHPSRLYPPAYQLAATYAGWTVTGVAAFFFFGNAGEGTVGRLLPLTFLLAALLSLIAPWDRLYRKERFMLLRSLKRIAFDGIFSPVPFVDVLVADVLTSLAKVLGDLYVSCGYLVNADTRENWGGQWGVPLVTALPYLFRLRQCIAECIASPASSYHLTSASSPPTPPNARARHLLNAVKYASAFPVIILSALQGVDVDLFHSPERGASNALVIFWILAVLVNSAYSFWWDVTNDWGLGLLLPTSWRQLYAGRATPSKAHYEPLPSSSASSSRALRRSSRSRPSLGGITKASDPDLLSSTASSDAMLRPGTPSHSHYAGSVLLRPTLLLSDPLVYHLAIAVDLLLRTTWSLKLSSHLHAIHEIEQGVFALEALEVMRRWMWLFLRIEWESVRRANAASTSMAMELGASGSGEEVRMEERYRDDGPVASPKVNGDALPPEKASPAWEPLALRPHR